MRRLRKWLSASLALAIAAVAVSTAVQTYSSAAEEVVRSAKKYVPQRGDMYAYSSSILEELEGGGIKLSDRGGLSVPLEGGNIGMVTEFTLKSKRAVADGGDGADEWLTYSFTDEAITGTETPRNGANHDGFYLSITNYSSTSAPNCVEVQVVQCVNGVKNNPASTFFLDNALNTPVSLGFIKADDGYTLSFTRVSDGKALKNLSGIAVDESVFINDAGQTYFSTHMYSNAGTNKGTKLSLYSVQAYTPDASAADIALDKDSYVYEGKPCTPEVTVKIGNTTLIENTDYTVTYSDNVGIGTAKATIVFIGKYVGNAAVEKSFTIAEGFTVELERELYEYKAEQTYMPEVTVKAGETTLIENTDYTVTYSDNDGIGTAKATVTFIGAYEGCTAVERTFLIVSGESDDSEGFTAKAYVPDKFDAVDFYGAVGDIESEAERGGFTTFAHAGMIVPLEGRNVQMTTQFKLLSKTAAENGGDGIDGWVTYSFSAVPADGESDKSYPYYGGNADGYFLHITNYSSSAAPNCVEVQFVKMQNGKTENVTAPFFMDNALGVRLVLSLVKQNNGTYTLTFETAEGTVLKKAESLPLDDSLFINENGQTFFSAAVYEAVGCDGNHWEHRGVSVYSVQAYTRVISADDVVLSQMSYEYSEGIVYKPEAAVTVDGKALVKDTDYIVEYENNEAVGTATAKIVFVGAYAGNVIEKTFTITESNPPDDGSSSDNFSDENSSTGNSSDENSSGTSSTTEMGCGSFLALGGALAATVVLGTALIVKKRNR